MSGYYETRYVGRRKPTRLIYGVIGGLVGAGLGTLGMLVIPCPKKSLHRLQCVAYSAPAPEIRPDPYGMIRTGSQTLRAPEMICVEGDR